MNRKISAVYKIVNTVTGDFYIGSSKNVYQRWASHKKPSTWKRHPNNPLYLDIQKYGLNNFRFQILAPVIPDYLKQVEQELFETLQPFYNDRRAKGLDVERLKKCQRKYRQSDKGKESRKKCKKKYQKSERGKETDKTYQSQPCLYNGETLTLRALMKRFKRQGIEHPFVKATKYLIKNK